MPEEKRRRSQAAESSNGRQRRSSQPVPGAQVAQRARKELAEITGLPAQGVTALEQYDDGTWKVTVELLELSRIPETDDIIGSYDVEVDQDGQLIGYRRLRRYARSHILEEQGFGGT